MFTIVFSPQWFYGIDIFIDIISIVVLCLIAFFSFKYYLLDTKNKNYFFLTLSFLLIAVSFFFKILTNFTIYYDVFNTQNIGIITFTYQTFQSSDLLFTIGYYLFRLLTLFGFLILYSITKKQSVSTFLIISFLFIVLNYFAQNAYHVFYATCFVMLFFLSLNYFEKYKESKRKTTLLLMYSFIIIAISQIIFYLMRWDNIYYAIAEIVQLIGYAILLVTFIMILYHGRKINDVDIKKIKQDFHKKKR